MMNNSRILLDDLLKEIPVKVQKAVTRKMLLAAKISDAIEAKGWTQKIFAERVNKDQSIVCKWLSGTHNFTIETLGEIEDALGIELLNIGVKPKQSVYNIVVSAEKAKRYPRTEMQSGSTSTTSIKYIR
jgi:ribosome-binding protein aMBF1 (putative translation factor)